MVASGMLARAPLPSLWASATFYLIDRMTPLSGQTSRYHQQRCLLALLLLLFTVSPSTSS